MNETDIAYVEKVTKLMLTNTKSGEQLVNEGLTAIGSTIEFLCTISDTDTMIRVMDRIQGKMVENSDRLKALHDAVVDSLILHKDLAEL